MPTTTADNPNVTKDLVVDVAGVSQWFGDVQALTNLTIEVPKGAITVLLGPNGAGKTTAIRMITGALTPGEGSVSVFGMDPVSSDGEEVRRNCGVVSAKPSLYDRLDGWDNLRYAAELHGLGRKADVRIREAAAQFGIDAALDLQVGGYSTGMKTRLALARSILHEPELLLLDEPTSGLDPESAASVLELIRAMTSDGRTVLLCTHLLLEAEGLADEIVIMEHGTSLLWGEPTDLARQFWPTPSVRITAESGSELDHLADRSDVVDYARNDHTATVNVDSLDLVPGLISSLVERRVRLTGVVPFTPTLEDLYFAVRKDRTTSAIPAPTQPPATRGRPSRRDRVAEMAR